MAQTKIEGVILDKTSQQPLPYSTITIFGEKTHHTITNEDGKFAVEGFIQKDSMEVRHLGYKTKKVALVYFKNEANLYLDPDFSNLDEVVLTAGEDKEYPYILLDKIVQKYRQQKEATSNKAFLTLTSSVRGIPLEQIEGFYNSEQSLSGGIMGLTIKSGRFGLNKSFAFYSLDNTQILSDFTFFEETGQILPDHPGNLNYNSLKRKYTVRIDDCSSCTQEEASLSFTPKNPNGRLFYGKMIVDYENLIVKKIELGIKDPITNALTSINETVSLTPMEIEFNIVFNPLDFGKIQYLDFSFQMDYKSGDVSEIINSRTFIYFYDYNRSFEEPYFTKDISFSNDYDKIIALQASDDFWETNYQYPKSFSEQRSLDYMKENGFLINYDSYIPVDDLSYARPSVLSWHEDKRFAWDHLRDATDNDPKGIQGDKQYRTGKNYDSPFDVLRKTTGPKGKNQINIGYMLDLYWDLAGNRKIIGRTLLDIGSSEFTHEHTKNKLIYINLLFDIYEIYRRLANSRIKDGMTFTEMKSIYDEVYEGANVEAKNMSKETDYGDNLEALAKWNGRIKSRLDIDNFSLLR
ncbi:MULTISPECIES: carboxypeptidase-like regulatory domain-containing protein [Flavobacteriaceae]|uniref:carboxypeptidase-like regulatory domain-containing protein n=1 Tax=Flavobacteriaceae TaxID=49546 RepID=UPI00234A1342|nr:carboxypeptidase-like regulatory domain-containing protein [Muricauda sp. SP22]MDC6363521.1 carboxypeptidase-like regulatory domain-containing protein [Muricauda sp. SP22]